MDSNNTPNTDEKTVNNKKKTVVIIVVICIVAVVVAISVYNILRIRAYQEQADTVNQELQQIAHIETPAPSPTAVVTATETPTETPEETPLPESPVDFTALQSENADICGWIVVDSTIIDYPVLYREDDFYLGNDAQKNPSPAGAIFLDQYNSNDFTDKHSVIYGHNMKNGDMFAGLHNYMDHVFFQENNTFTIYTPQGQLDYEIVAAYISGDERLTLAVDAQDKVQYQEYINSIYEHRGINDHFSDRRITVDDTLVTLSTCVRGQDENLYLVQGVLIKNDEGE